MKMKAVRAYILDDEDRTSDQDTGYREVQYTGEYMTIQALNKDVKRLLSYRTHRETLTIVVSP